MKVADFDFQKQLGTGSFSKVMEVVHRTTGVRYAVKLISKRTILNASTEEERTRMAEVARRESRMLLMCDHPNIVKFYGSMQTPEDLVYVTELCGGGELLKAIRARGRIPIEACRHSIAEVFSAVFYLHSEVKRNVGQANNPQVVTIIHRDIKPENVMLGEGNHVKLIDFGTAVVCEKSTDRAEEKEATGKGRAQTFCGTTYYMSPELLQDSYTCCESDYWGCGCVLYHMLLGKRPFDTPTQYLLIKAILEQEPDYPDNMDSQAKDLIQKLLEKSPDKRPSADEIKRHPFFASINWSTLATTDVADYWVRETPWVDESEAVSCTSCATPWRGAEAKDYCRYCGDYFCLKCLTGPCLLPYFRYTTPQPVCAKCFNEVWRE